MLVIGSQSFVEKITRPLRIASGLRLEYGRRQREFSLIKKNDSKFLEKGIIFGNKAHNESFTIITGQKITRIWGLVWKELMKKGQDLSSRLFVDT
jgi:hypothetical protein